MLSKLGGRTTNWVYPLAIGVVIGVLVAGLTYRIAPDRPAGSSAATEFGGGETPGAVDGAAPLPGESAAPAATVGPGTTGASPGAVPGGSSGGAGPVTGPSGSPGGPAVNGGGGLTASDVGVSATTIKVGVALLDLGGASSAGAAVPGFDPKVQRRQWEVFIKELNGQGGILGRKVQAYFRSVNVLSPQDQQAACVEFTQTHRVFLVFDWGNAMGPDGDLCVSAQNRTLVVSGVISPGNYYQAARGLLITTTATGTRVGRAWARTMQRVGKLKGKTLGLLVDQGSAESMVKAGLVPELQRLGYKVTYTAVVSNDPSQGPSQVPAQVVQMQRAGVNTVFMASAFYNMTSFVNQAEKQGWRPQYAVSDMAGSDIATLLNGMPESFDGAIAATYYPPGLSAKSPESATGRNCRERWNKATGENLKPSGQDYGNVTGVCLNMDLLKTAGSKTGTRLTRLRFSSSVQGLGRSFDWGGMGGSFGPGKTDYANVLRTMVWGPPAQDTDSAYCTSNKARCFNNGIPPYDPGV